MTDAVAPELDVVDVPDSPCSWITDQEEAAAPVRLPPVLPSCAQAMKLMSSVTETRSLQNKTRLLADISRAFAVLSHPDAVAAGLFHFLFSVDHQQDLAILTDLEAIEYAYTLSISDSEIHIGDASQNMFDSESVVDIMCIPAATHGVFSYGIMCKNRYGTGPMCAKSQAKPARNVFVGRYCRNESNGDVFVVQISDTDGQTNVAYLNNLTSTSREHLRLTFDTAVLRGHNGVLRFAEAARKRSYGRQNRFCPVCNAPPSFKCGCSFSYQIPYHARDFSGLRANSIHMMAGDFYGEMEYVAYCSSVDKFIDAKVMSRMSANAKLILASPSVLHQTVIQIRLGAASRLKLEMPMISLDGTETSASQQLAVRDDGELHRPFTAEEPDMRDAMFALPDETSFQPTPMADFENTDLDLTSSRSLTTPSVRQPFDCDECVDNLDDASWAKPSEEVIDSVFPGIGEELPWTYDDLHVTFNDIFSPTTSESTHGSSEEEVREPKNPKTVVKRKASLKRDSDLKVDMERAARQELRRQKNRAAAARSNALRKERNINLRRDLAHVRERVQVLKGLEKVAREENESLRSQVGHRISELLNANSS